MQAEQMLAVMKKYFDEDQPPELMARFPEVRASQLVDDSIEVITFIVYLEDELGLSIKTDQLGPAIGKMTFQELAAELCRMNGD